MVKILLIVDNASDVELAKVALNTMNGIELVYAKDFLSFKNIYKPGEFSAILSDYNISNVLGTDVLAYTRNLEPEIPFIIISGALGEERAVEILRQGATDYVLKDSLNKLPLVVSRALNEAEIIKAEKLARIKLRANEEKLRSINQNSPDLMNTVNKGGIITYSNRLPTGCTSEEDVIGKNVLDFVSEVYKVKYQEHLLKAFNGEPQEFVMQGFGLHLNIGWYRVRMAAEQTTDQIDSLLVISTDITLRKDVLDRQEVVNNISRELNNDVSISHFLENIKYQLGKIFNTDNFYVGSYNSVNDELTFIFQYIQNSPDPDIPYGRVNGNGLSEYVIKTKRSLLLRGNNIVDFQNKNGIFIHMDRTVSWMGVPVMHNEDVFGVVAVLSFSDEMAFNEKDQELLTFVGSQIGAFIKRKESEQKLRDSQIKWDSLAMNSGDLILTLSTNYQINYINKLPKSFESFGITLENLLGEKFVTLVAASYADTVSEKLESSIASKTTSSFMVKGGFTGNLYECSVIPLIQEEKLQGLIVIMKNITDLTVAHNKVKESEERYKNVVQDQTEYIVRWKPDGQILFANKSYLDFNEATAEELFEKSYFSLIPKNEKSRFQTKIKSLSKDNPVLIDSHQSSRGKKGAFWHEWVDRAFFNENGDVIEYQSVGRDITIQKMAELKIRESEEFKHSILSALFSNIAVINNNGIIISTNEQWNDFAIDNNGTLIKTGVGVSYIDACNNSIKNGDKIASMAISGIREVLSSKKKLFELEYPCHSDMQERWFLMRVTPFKGHEGGAVIAHYDVTEQKIQQKRIIESENKYRSLFEKMHEGLFVSSDDGIIQMVNPQFAAMLGYDETELLGKNGYFLLLGDEERARIMPKVDDRKIGLSESYETVLLKKNGDHVYVNFSSSPVYNEKNDFQGIMSIVSDISGRKSAEVKLKLSYNEIKNLEKISNAVIRGKSLPEITEVILKSLDNFSGIISSRLYLYDANHLHLELFGETRSDLLQSKINTINGLKINLLNHLIEKDSLIMEIIDKKDTFITNDEDKIHEILISYSSRISFKNFKSLITDNLGIRTVGILPIISDDHVIGAILFSSSEILSQLEIKSLNRFSQHAGTALAKKRTEEELREYKENLEKLVAVRTNKLNELNNELESFNYSVSHDLRTPIRAIDIYSGLLAQELKNTELYNYVSQIEKCTLEMNELIKSLLEFSKMTKVPIAIEAVDLNLIVLNCFEKQKESERAPHAHLRMDKMPIVLADNKLLTIVINNLLSNAIKYSSDKDEPLVEVGYTDTDKNYMIYIKDNGIGFDSKLSDKLFKPFSRLHHGDQFKGTGAGLAIVDRILKRHNGKIYAESEVNNGSVFYFTLPKKYDHIEK